MHPAMLRVTFFIHIFFHKVRIDSSIHLLFEAFTSDVHG